MWVSCAFTSFNTPSHDNNYNNNGSIRIHFIDRASHTEQKIQFYMHFSKSPLFLDIARYIYYVTDIRLTDALICF